MLVNNEPCKVVRQRVNFNLREKFKKTGPDWSISIKESERKLAIWLIKEMRKDVKII